MAKHIADHDRLFGDFLGHEVAVTAFVDRGCADVDPALRAIGLFAVSIENLH